MDYKYVIVVVLYKKYKEECGRSSMERVEKIHTCSAQTIFWEDRYSSSIRTLALRKSELKLKRLARISTETATRSSPVVTSFGVSRYIIHVHIYKTLNKHIHIPKKKKKKDKFIVILFYEVSFCKIMVFLFRKEL